MTAYHVTTSQDDDVHDVSRNAEQTDENTNVAVYRLVPLTERHQLTAVGHRSSCCIGDAVVHHRRLWCQVTHRHAAAAAGRVDDSRFNATCKHDWFDRVTTVLVGSAVY